MDLFTLFGRLAKGTDAIRDEIQASGTYEDQQCLDYILHQRAGSWKKKFPNSPYHCDCDENGLRDDRKVKSGEHAGKGMKLADFVAHSDAQVAQLAEPHVVALRLYSTAAFRSLNNSLRNQPKHTLPGNKKKRESHPFAATIYYLAEGIKQLRAVEADHAEQVTSPLRQQRPLDLFRGMRDMTTSEEFMTDGGSERALMSSTSNLAVALQYGLSASSLLFVIRTKSFMERGADSAQHSPQPSMSIHDIPYPTESRTCVHARSLFLVCLPGRKRDLVPAAHVPSTYW